MSLDYTKITHESLLAEWNNRVLADDRYKNLSHASIYSFFQEFLAGTMDLVNYYIQRTAEENYLDTAKLDSSVIKLAHNLGYQPRRPVPAVADIVIELRGPLPKTVQAGDTIWLNNEALTFSFNGHDFMLDACYSYELTAKDISDGKDPSWRKKIRFATDGYAGHREGYIALDGNVNSITAAKLYKIGILQGKRVKKIIEPLVYSNQIGLPYQIYDINDVKFSNYYGVRDPFATLDGHYSKKFGMCRIGIGRTETEAMLEENLYDIEELAVEMNSKFKNDDELTEREISNQAQVVALTSNYDKTVRLEFGNGVSTSCGLKSTDDILCVEYLITDGSDANYPDAEGSELRVVGKVYASGEGRMTNLTNYVSFILDTEIHGGQDFESRDSIKRNAKIFYASNGKLITLPDYQSWLLTLTDPIIVKNAIAYGENQIEDKGFQHDAGMSNFVLYTIFSDVYRKYDGRYRPINVFDEDEDLSNTSLYIDYSTYMNHLVDFVRLMSEPKNGCTEQMNDTSTFGTWCARIRDAAGDRAAINTKLLSLPPIFHYYDVVGDIQVDRHIDMSKLKDNLENSIYEWLAENTTFNTKIYKSDLIDRILQNSDCLRANIDIKVSELIKGEKKTYRFAKGLVKNNQDILIVPVRDIRGNDMRDVLKNLVGLNIDILVQDGTDVAQTFTVKNFSADDEYVYLKLNGTPSIVSDYMIDLMIEEDSLNTKGNLSSISDKMTNLLTNWVASKAVVEGTDDRPISLPYVIQFDPDKENNLEYQMKVIQNLAGYFMELKRTQNSTAYDQLITLYINQYNVLKAKLEQLDVKNVREETFQRIGANTTDVSLNLSEDSFYYMLIDNLKSGNLGFDEVKNSMPYMYPALKAIFDDNVLDDNNNIVYYSSEREIPVLRLRFRYTYA